jgi:hypothetical protein
MSEDKKPQVINTKASREWEEELCHRGISTVSHRIWNCFLWLFVVWLGTLCVAMSLYGLSWLFIFGAGYLASLFVTNGVLWIAHGAIWILGFHGEASQEIDSEDVPGTQKYLL